MNISNLKCPVTTNYTDNPIYNCVSMSWGRFYGTLGKRFVHPPNPVQANKIGFTQFTDNAFKMTG